MFDPNIKSICDKAVNNKHLLREGSNHLHLCQTRVFTVYSISS